MSFTDNIASVSRHEVFIAFPIVDLIVYMDIHHEHGGSLLLMHLYLYALKLLNSV